jgi:hypothetical protein
MNTAIAIEAKDAGGKVVPGVLALLTSPALPGGILADVTNGDGYAVWANVPVPFSGVLKLSGIASPYGSNGNGEPVNVAGANVTLRVGGAAVNPGDVVLPACVPFL